MKKLAYILATTLFTSVQFAQADDAASAKLYTEKACLSCHGEAGAKPIMEAYPKLAGQSAAYMVQQMKDIRDGKRTNGLSATMMGIMAGMSDDDIGKIASYLASLAPAPATPAATQ